MAKDFPLVETKQYTREAVHWLEAIGRRENVAALFFPKMDRLRRLQQLLQDKEFLKKVLGRKAFYLFQVIDFSTSIIEDRTDLQEHIARQLNLSSISVAPRSFDDWLTYFRQEDIHVVLVLPEAEKYLTPATSSILDFLSYVITDFTPYLSIFAFYEADLSHSVYHPMLPTSTLLLENIFSYPLYDMEDTFTFIRYLQQKWNLQMSSKEEQEVITYCGGHFWFVKEALRQLVSRGSWSIDEESMRFRWNTIYHTLLPSEQSVFEKVSTRQESFTSDERRSLLHLKKMNAIDSGNRNVLKIFEHYILNQQDTSMDFTLRDQHVILNNIPVDKFFSKKEYRVMKLLLEKKGTVVSRDEIADRIWPINTQEQYSDWAIDQLITRIRKRLMQLALSPSTLQVVRGKGYLLKIS